MDSKKVLIKIDGIARTKEVAWIGKNYNGNKIELSLIILYIIFCFALEVPESE